MTENEDLLWQAFRAGFAASAEGYNGEMGTEADSDDYARWLVTRFGGGRVQMTVRVLPPSPDPVAIEIQKALT